MKFNEAIAIVRKRQSKQDKVLRIFEPSLDENAVKYPAWAYTILAIITSGISIALWLK